MKLIFLGIFASGIGFGATYLYLSSEKSSASAVLKLKDRSLTQAFVKIKERSESDLESTNQFESIGLLEGVSLSRSDSEMLKSLPENSKERLFAEAVILGAYPDELTDEEYQKRMEDFRLSLETSPEENFKAALSLYEMSEFHHPIRRASIIKILTSIKGKEVDGLQYALKEASTPVLIDEDFSTKPDEEKENHLLSPLLSYEAALEVMKQNDIDPYEETLRILESQESIDIKKGIVEKLETSFPQYKGKINL